MTGLRASIGVTRSYSNRPFLCTLAIYNRQSNNKGRQSNLHVNPLTTYDDYSRHQNSAACYQLAQSVLKIGSALTERVGQGEVGGCTPLGDSAWQLLQLAIEKA